MSKLHLPNPTNGQPLCGRQLVNVRAANSQTNTGRTFATTVQEFILALNGQRLTGGLITKPFACRHCGREAGLIPKVTRTVKEFDEESDQ